MCKKTVGLTAKVLLLLMLVIATSATWLFSAQSAGDSNAWSRQVVQSIEKQTAYYFTINPGDTFWNVTLNQIIRKVAHFTEYAVIGLLLCLLLNLFLRRAWLAGLLSLAISPVFAYIDEYHQKFSFNRTPQWFDVYVDWSGAVAGILLVTLLFMIANHVRGLHREIRRLRDDQSHPSA